MEASLFRYIWNETRKEQIWILLIILASMPFNFLMLDSAEIHRQRPDPG